MSQKSYIRDEKEFKEEVELEKKTGRPWSLVVSCLVVTCLVVSWRSLLVAWCSDLADNFLYLYI